MHENTVKSSFCTVNSNGATSNKACVSPELAKLIYDKVENNEVLRTESIKPELCKPERREQQIEQD